MPKARSRYARAQARARYRKPSRRRKGSLGWNIGFISLALVGVALVIFTVVDRQSAADARPRAANQAANQAGDHWHAAIDVNVCGEKLANAQTFEKRADNQSIQAGIHTHGDGVIHIHPYASDESGTHATLGRFFTYGGWKLSSDSFTWWTGSQAAPNKTSWKNGDTCTTPDGKKEQGVVRWSVNGKEQHGNPADYHPRDQDSILVAFLPAHAKLPAVESRTPEQDSGTPTPPIGGSGGSAPAGTGGSAPAGTGGSSPPPSS